MSAINANRRNLMGLGLALMGSNLIGQQAYASGSVTAAIYPGTWDDTYRNVIGPALKSAHGIEVAFEPLFAVDQLAKVAASRGLAPFDTMVLDPGPRAAAIARGLLEPFDASKLSNASKLPAGYVDEYGAAAAAQIVGIAYNPKKLPKPTSWKDLFEEPFVSRLGLTGFQTTYGTVSLIEMSKVFGGSETNVDPVFEQIAKILPKVAAVTPPKALPSLFQQGQIDVTYTNTNTVAALQAKGVDIDIAFPETGGISFVTTLHVAKGAENVANAYKFIDTVIAAQNQTTMMGPPSNFIPINLDVEPKGLPISSLTELTEFNSHDWLKINPLRAGWIERFNKEMRA